MVKEGFIICENSFKEGFLTSINGIHNYTFLSMDELLKKLLFDVKKEGIVKLILKYKIKPEIAKEYIEYLKYIDLFFDNPKLNFLKEVYEYLKIEDMIIYDENYKSYLRKRPITIMGYIYSKKLDFLFNVLKKEGYEYTYIEQEKRELIKRDVFSFFDIDDEARYVFNSIKELLDNGFSINNIKIANYSSDYDFVFHRLEAFYNIPINFKSEKNILSIPIAKFIINNIDNYNDYYSFIDGIKAKYSNSIYYKNIISIINAYHLYNYSPKETKDLVISELKNINYDRKIYEDGIQLVDLGSPSIKEDDIVFIIGFNQTYIPPIFSDDGFLNDDILSKMNLDTSIDNTIEYENVVINNLNLNLNYKISYKLKSPFDSYLPSPLIEKLGYNTANYDTTIGINECEDKIIIGNVLDEYFKYGSMDEESSKKIYDINYLSFDNKFKGISDDNLKKYLPEIIKLSYSSMSNYSKCAFRYLMSSVLYLDKFESGLAAYIGTYSHKILELAYKNNDFEANKLIAIQEVLNEKKNANYGIDSPLTNKEKFFIDSMDLILKEVIDFNKEHEINHTRVQNEYEIQIPYDNNKLIFKGFVDKILIEDGAKTYVTIIDYKTGADEASLDNISDGFNLQLPIYLLMIKKSKEFNNPLITGFYLQKIGPKDYPNFKLFGFTNKDDEIMNHIDNFLDTSNYIRSLKRNKNGEMSKNSKVISNDEMEDLANTVEAVMINVYENIRKGNFNINPKVISNVNIGCEYCNFKDVCFVKEEDKVEIVKNNFLKGE